MIDDYNIQMPGRIESYDPVTQLGVVRISNDKTYSNSTETSRQRKRVLLRDVPIQTPGGGDWHMTFPIKKGDACLISFSQFGYDHWLYEDKDSAGVRADGQPQTWTNRRFSTRDGFAQVGFNTIPRAIADYSATDSEWRNVDRQQRVTLEEGGNIVIATGSTVINVAKDGEVTMTTPTLQVNGAINSTGLISSDTGFSGPSAVIGGIEVAGHDHVGDSGGNTGPMK